MSLRHIDARFLLPRAPQRALVLGEPAGWRDGLEAAGIATDACGRPDLAVADASHARGAIESGAPMILIEGAVRRRTLDAAGLGAVRFLQLPRAERPELFVPLDDPVPARYALTSWAAPRQRWKRARNTVLREALDRGLVPPLGAQVTVALRSRELPFLVRAAAERLGLPAGCAWLLTLSQGDETRLGAFHLFEPDAAGPALALKFARVPGMAWRFDLEERGLAAARSAGGEVAAHAPRLLGRFELDGLHASVETAAVGVRLTNALLGPGRRADKLALVDRVAQWLVGLARATAGAPRRLEPVRYRHAQLAPPSLAAELPKLAPVLVHGDLGTANVVVGGPAGFTVIDWEDARAHGFPLWDLAYLLADALALVDGAWRSGREGLDRHFARLFRGELASSAFLLRRLREAAEATAVPAESVGRILALCWLDLPAEPHRARIWLRDPALGPDWRGWQS